jgi:hypothetical protein
VTERVVAERGQEQAGAREPGELNRGDGSATADLLPCLVRVDDLAGRGHVLDARELNPLDVPDYRDPHPA